MLKHLHWNVERTLFWFMKDIFHMQNITNENSKITTDNQT